MNFHRRQFLAGTLAALAARRAVAGFGKYTFGVVAPTRDFDNSVKYGFDYHEPSVCEVAGMSNAEFDRFKDHVLSSRIRCLRLNFFTSPPAGFDLPVIRIVGPDVDKSAVRAYVEKSLDRCKQLGAQRIVWGSSASRKVPDGFPREKAWVQIHEFLAMTDPIARSHDILVAIEPIRSPGCNILTTGAEVLKMQREVNLPNIKMMIDYYQMRAMNEDPEILWTARKEIVHIHFANPNLNHGTSLWPKNLDEDPEYGKFFALLKKIGYAGGISIEAKGTYEDCAADSLAFFRKELA
jgi:sugar phosphate isomerase/epimerase